MTSLADLQILVLGLSIFRGVANDVFGHCKLNYRQLPGVVCTAWIGLYRMGFLQISREVTCHRASRCTLASSSTQIGLACKETEWEGALSIPRKLSLCSDLASIFQTPSNVVDRVFVQRNWRSCCFRMYRCFHVCFHYLIHDKQFKGAGEH